MKIHKTTLLLIVIVFFLNINQGVIAQISSKPLYTGTSNYPYWGLYQTKPMSEVKAATWLSKDTVINNWEWSLPDFISIPKKSTFSLLRTGLTAYNLKELNALSKPGFPCKPSVAFWVKWSDLEPTEGKYNFDTLMRRINLVNSKGYQSIVRILSSATIFAPSWLSNYGIPTWVGSKVTNYEVSHPAFHSRYLKLIEALGKRGLPQMPSVAGLYVGYSSSSYGDEGIGPYTGTGAALKNDTVPHVRERLNAWANACKGVETKVFMGGEVSYGINKGFGLRRGFVEHYMYNIPNESIGQKVDANNYLYVDEQVPIISKNLFQGEENEEYGPDIATSAFDFRFGPTTESFNYRYFSSNIRILQMRCNELLNYNQALMPEMLAWLGQNLGRTIDEAPDVFSFLRETRMKYNGHSPVKNFERWLFQRDAPGYETQAAVRINYDNYKTINIVDTAQYDLIARLGKKIGYNLDKRWPALE